MIFCLQRYLMQLYEHAADLTTEEMSPIVHVTARACSCHVVVRGVMCKER